MPSMTHVIGIDPGLVHTGVVSIIFDPSARTINIDHEVIDGPDWAAAHRWIQGAFANPVDAVVFIEGYRPRSAFDTDQRMVKAVNDFRRALGGQVINNTGVKKVIRHQLLDMLGLWKFSTTSHHQDLRSAAYIALYGIVKDEEMNRLLAGVVLDYLTGDPWVIRS